MSMNQNLCVNKTNFHVKGFALGLTLKQRQKATRKPPISINLVLSDKTIMNFITRKSMPKLFMYGSRPVGQTHVKWQVFEKPENKREIYGS